ncbi:MAG: 4Fe-4S dicluster domain-containing protein [Syntrophomonadaceae bacterium]|nr:4Fe-4S dicluster domain-containing protein [Syntrophomonadaceae bacterium]
MQTFKKESIDQVLAAWAHDAVVYVPVSQAGSKEFGRWSLNTRPDFTGNTRLSPKGLMFLQTESMYSYTVTEGGMGVVLEEIDHKPARQVIVGIRPCDVQSVQVMDEVFLTKGYVDKLYKEKRDHTCLVALGCLSPLPTCFCSSMGLNPMAAPGADLMMYDLGDSYGIIPQSEAGEALIASLGGLVLDGGQVPAGNPCTLKVDTEGLTAKLQKMFEHPLWNKVNQKCLACGTCTYLCPTCHCFDIQGKNKGDEGYKFRCWDSCMYPEYTLMAGGHQPRSSKKERLRQRFLHKLQYMPERYHAWGCVGCGRCLAYCPVQVDITRFMRDVKEVAIDG